MNSCLGVEMCAGKCALGSAFLPYTKPYTPAHPQVLGRVTLTQGSLRVCLLGGGCPHPSSGREEEALIARHSLARAGLPAGTLWLL